MINKLPPASKHIWIYKGLHTPFKADDAIVFNILRVPNRHISQVHLQIKPHESRDTFAGKKGRLKSCIFCPFCYAIVLLPFLWAFFMGKPRNAGWIISFLCFLLTDAERWVFAGS